MGDVVPINISITSLGSGDAIVLNPNGTPAQGGLIDWGDGKGAKQIPLTLAGTASPIEHIRAKWLNNHLRDGLGTI